ncbi:hypothetical protein ACFU7T_04575 [Streptomyces sp. NPDC057555]|uniref:hypothetical protein n=1 Tax=Streptomyces sp. NPDC057555 TaxID=3346166 RepID=UPI00367BCF90
MRNTKPPSPAVRSTALSVCALLAATVLTACGAGDGGGVKAAGDAKGGVSTLETGSPAPGGKPGAPTSTKVDSRRPQLRMDSSEEEINRLDDAYHACLQSHGVPMNTERAKLAGAKQASPVQGEGITKKYKPAFDACLVKMPLEPPELDSKVNPHYTDDYRVYVKCINNAGMRVHMLQDEHGIAIGWTYDDDHGSNGLSDAEQTKIDKKCKTEAFGGKKG